MRIFYNLFAFVMDNRHQHPLSYGSGGGGGGHLDGQVVPQGLVEATGHAAVLGGVDECGGAQDVVQHVAGQRVALLALEAQGQLQDLHQRRPVR